MLTMQPSNTSASTPIKMLLLHELKLKVAGASGWLLPLVFFLMVLTVFAIALGGSQALLERVAVALVWTAVLLATLLSSMTLFSEDVSQGHFEQILVAGISPTLWVMVKLFSHWLLSGLLLSIMALICIPFFGISWHSGWWLFVTLLLGSPVLLLFSALAASLTLSLPTASALVPIIALPLMLPVVIFAVSIPQTAEMGLPVLPTVALLAAILLSAMLLLPWTIAQSLKLAVD